MAEETKKKTTKKVQHKKTTNKKSEKKVNVQANEEKTTVKKPIHKKPQPKKQIPKKETKEIKKIEEIPEVQEQDNEESILLEKTMVFDGEQNKNLEEVVNKLEEDNLVLKDKVVKRSRVRKNIVIGLSILIGIVIISTIVWAICYEKGINKQEGNKNTNIYQKVVSSTKENEEQVSADKFDEEETKNIEEQSTYSNIKDISLEEFETKIINRENITVMISSSTCYFCLTFEPILNEALKEQEKIVYRLNIHDMNNETLKRLREYYPYKMTPSLFSVRDGLVIEEITGLQEKEVISKWLSEYSL